VIFGFFEICKECSIFDIKNSFEICKKKVFNGMSHDIVVLKKSLEDILPVDQVVFRTSQLWHLTVETVFFLLNLLNYRSQLLKQKKILKTSQFVQKIKHFAFFLNHYGAPVISRISCI
jgi:hypothetical protein